MASMWVSAILLIAAISNSHERVIDRENNALSRNMINDAIRELLSNRMSASDEIDRPHPGKRGMDSRPRPGKREAPPSSNVMDMRPRPGKRDAELPLRDLYAAADPKREAAALKPRSGKRSALYALKDVYFDLASKPRSGKREAYDQAVREAASRIADALQDLDEVELDNNSRSLWSYMRGPNDFMFEDGRSHNDNKKA